MRRFSFSLLLILVLLNIQITFAKSAIRVVHPQVERLTNPIGLEYSEPTFSWELVATESGVKQLSYRILVASSVDLLNKNQADVWDSQLQKSDQSNYIVYRGKALQSGQRYYWKALVKTNKGTAYSENSFWEMGLMNHSDWKATWIGRSYSDDVLTGNTKLRARYLRKDFSISGQIKKAILYICGLGLYEAFINGQRIGKAELAPTPTDYRKSVRYNTYDVTDAVVNGKNAIGVVLGNGRYVAMRIPRVLHFGQPQLLAQLEITVADGKKYIITSDTSWKITNQGPIGLNNEYDGEVYNARQEMKGWSNAGFDDSRWQLAEKIAAPAGELLAQVNPNITIMDHVKPISIREQRPGVYILDMGQNMVGWLKVKLHGNEGDTLKIHFVETLQKDGSIYTANIREAETTDTYITNGQPAIWQPSFTYHGFRFVELTGFKQKPNLSDFEGEVLYDEMATTGTFTTSNQILNRIYRNAFWGIRGNYRGMPTDCPQRDERMGWLGDRAVGALGECYVFNNHLLYAKWLRDIEETQREDGSISDVAPVYWAIYNDDVTWPSAWFTVANMLYDQFGDTRPIKQHYAAMKKYMLHIKDSYMQDGVITRDQYGDWCMPPESLELIHAQDPNRKTDGALLSTAFYIHLCRLMARFATINQKPDDAAFWQNLAVQMNQDFTRKFYHPDKGFYGNNTVTSNILPLRMGLMPEEYRTTVFKNIVEKTVNEFNSHVSTGLIGIQQLLRGLTDNGQGELALKIATNTTYPSWGYMAEQGATTIWELWNGNTADPAMNSGNHVMLLGDLLIWSYQYLAGIGQQEGSQGFKRIELKPWPIKGLDHVSASYHSIYGDIKSAWKTSGNRFSWQFTIPANTTARVYIPLSNRQLSAKEAKGLTRDGKFVGLENGYAVFDFVSGDYEVNL